MSDFIPCPHCPDGSVWGSEGPTGRTCPTCGGFAVLHKDGERVTRAEFDAECEPEAVVGTRFEDAGPDAFKDRT